MARQKNLVQWLRDRLDEPPVWEPEPWFVHVSPPCTGLYAKAEDEDALMRTLARMDRLAGPLPTDRDGVEFWPLDLCELLVVDEPEMREVMRCVRLTRLHGRYRKAGTEREYRF